MQVDKASDALRDAAGTHHQPCDLDPATRIVSLVPSITELLCDLGLAPWLVGRTGYCIHPAATVKAIAKVGGTKTVNLDKIRRLAPSHCIVNIDENEKPAVDSIAAFVPHIVVTHPQTPRDNLALYRLMGGIFRAENKAERLCARFEAGLAVLAAERQTRAWPARRVLYLIWQDPWMTVARDTYIAAMLALIDWQQIDVCAATSGGSRRYPAIDLEAAARDADTILLSSEPYRFTTRHVADLTARFPGKHVVLIDGEMLSWYGSRAIAGLGYITDLAANGARPRSAIA